MSTRDTSGSAPQHSHPHNNTVSRNEKFWVDQVTVPPPPPGNDKGWGTTRGGEGTVNNLQILWCINNKTENSSRNSDQTPALATGHEMTGEMQKDRDTDTGKCE